MDERRWRMEDGGQEKAGDQNNRASGSRKTGYQESRRSEILNPSTALRTGIEQGTAEVRKQKNWGLTFGFF